jgi:hypothetical protein
VWLEDKLPRINPNARSASPFIFEMLFCPHDVLNEIVVFEKLNTAINATPQFRSSDFLCERHNHTLGGVGEGKKSPHLDRD